MKMRHRKAKRAVVIEYGAKGMQPIRYGRMRILSCEIVGHDEHNSWARLLIARTKH